jgi:hypothetical protein
MVLATDLAVALDAARLAVAMGIDLDPWQADILRSDARRVLINCARQSGKSTIVAIKAVHRALYSPSSLIVLISPSLRQSQELFRKCLDCYRAVDRPVPAEAENRLTLELENGSRIVSLPGKEGTIRGYSGVDLLLIDEASRVADGLYASVRPMLAVSNGQLIAPSTPYGTRGWWYEAWQSTEPWERYEVPATEISRISREFLAEEHRNMGQWWYEQEYMCRFLDAESQAFRRADIDRAFSEDIETWQL